MQRKNLTRYMLITCFGFMAGVVLVPVILYAAMFLIEPIVLIGFFSLLIYQFFKSNESIRSGSKLNARAAATIHKKTILPDG